MTGVRVHHNHQIPGRAACQAIRRLGRRHPDRCPVQRPTRGSDPDREQPRRALRVVGAIIELPMVTGTDTHIIRHIAVNRPDPGASKLRTAITAWMSRPMSGPGTPRNKADRARPKAGSSYGARDNAARRTGSPQTSQSTYIAESERIRTARAMGASEPRLASSARPRIRRSRSPVANRG
jgi:hypothetical protein